jgi:CRP/FNR family cyclic AMP-dependent transcriptional regulator
MDITLEPAPQTGRAALHAFIAASAWADGLRPGTLARLQEAAGWRDLAGGELLCRQGEPATHWYGIAAGLLRMDMLCEDGGIVTIAAGPVGEWVGEATLILQQPRRYEVTAMRASRVACIAGAVFLEVLEDDVQFNRAVLRTLSARVQYFIEHFAQARALDPERRIAAILVSLAGPSPQGGAPQVVEISQEELAQLAGVARQRANQALRSLQAQGLIELAYASITVLNPHALTLG